MLGALINISKQKTASVFLCHLLVLFDTEGKKWPMDTASCILIGVHIFQKQRTLVICNNM